MANPPRDNPIAAALARSDFFRTAEQGRAVLREWFRAHITLAKELGKPLQIHNRDAHADVIETLQNKINCMEIVRSAGFNVPPHSETAATTEQAELLASMADDLGYPLVIKACSGGRGAGSSGVYGAPRSPEKTTRRRLAAAAPAASCTSSST